MGSTTTAPQSTAELTGLHAGDSTAFAEAYRIHLPALTAHVATRLPQGDPDLVADLIHDAFADALADPTLIDTDVLRSLRRLCDRACARQAWSQKRYLRAAHSIYADAQRSELTVSPATAQPSPFDALAVLPAPERQVAHLRFLEGHTPKVTARLLGRSVRSVLYLERQACRRLREHLTEPATATPAPCVTGRA